MIGLEIRFLSGRFHANAWHHAHNEGISEWPPSPWRLLRALVSAAYDLDVVAEATPVLAKLDTLPRYRLPAAREAHVRHYMPDTDDAGHKKTKVFDSFVVVDGGAFAHDPQPVTAAWPTSLDAGERSLLDRLARRVAYLGRAESWADIRVVDVDGERFDCWPDESGSGSSTTLMALEAPGDFAAWAAEQPAPKKKGAQDVPRSSWDVLTFDGARFRDEGWSKVPGTRLARYVFAEPPFARRSATPRPRRLSGRQRPTVARYAIRSSVLPKMADALIIAERVRVALMSQSRKRSGDAKPVFSGHGDDATETHGHAFILPSADGNHEGRIDHVTVTARMGFDDDDIHALQAVTRVFGKGEHFLDLVLIGLGTAADYGGLAAPRSPLLASSRVWETQTPFIPTRHPKLVRGEWVDDIPSQIRRACVQLDLPVPVDVTPIEGEWFRYRRQRRDGGGRKGPDKAHGARIVFADPVRGPIALGFGAHFGLGTFVAKER